MRLQRSLCFFQWAGLEASHFSWRPRECDGFSSSRTPAHVPNASVESQEKELKQAADYTEPVSAKKDRQPRAAREEQEGVAEAQVARMRRHEEAREMSPDEMVPWVKWPATAAAKARGAAVGQKRTKLLQTTELFQDNAAKVMPLKEIEERLAVDHKLHRGFVSDTQLAAADAAARKKSAKFEGKRTKLLQTTELFQDNAAKVMPLKEIEERLAVDHKLHRGFVSDTQLAAADAAAQKKSAKFGEKKARSGSDGGLACDPFC